MDGLRPFKRLPSVVAVGMAVLATAACAIQLRESGNDAAAKQTSVRKAGPPEPDLARCRTVTLGQGAEFEQCRRIWSENRRRFFGHRTGRAASGLSEEMIPKKDQGRMLQGYPSVATPAEGVQ
ncbi:putative entry exclusion protein TrbK-alt [Bradyrhizobium elkanii]